MDAKEWEQYCQTGKLPYMHEVGGEETSALQVVENLKEALPLISSLGVQVLENLYLVEVSNLELEQANVGKEGVNMEVIEDGC